MGACHTRVQRHSASQALQQKPTSTGGSATETDTQAAIGTCIDNQITRQNLQYQGAIGQGQVFPTVADRGLSPIQSQTAHRHRNRVDGQSLGLAHVGAPTAHAQRQSADIDIQQI